MRFQATIVLTSSNGPTVHAMRDKIAGLLTTRTTRPDFVTVCAIESRRDARKRVIPKERRRG